MGIFPKSFYEDLKTDSSPSWERYLNGRIGDNYTSWASDW